MLDRDCNRRSNELSSTRVQHNVQIEIFVIVKAAKLLKNHSTPQLQICICSYSQVALEIVSRTKARKILIHRREDAIGKLLRIRDTREGAKDGEGC